MTLSDARSMASGWHFAKELLTPEEHRMLHVIEELLVEVDRLSGYGFAHVWPSEEDETPPRLPDRRPVQIIPGVKVAPHVAKEWNVIPPKKENPEQDDAV